MEERLNAITHGIGVLLAVTGLGMLVISAYRDGGLWHRVSFSIYGSTVVILFLMSTLYHSFTAEKSKYIFKILDHAAIYLLIAGTYTPFMMVALHGTLGWRILAAIWSLALVGIIFQLFFVKRFKLLSTICYILMGWFIVFAIKPLMAVLPVGGIYWLVIGGLFYTVGTVFYLWRRLPYHHAIWHLFVLGGSISHYIAVLLYVLPIQLGS